MSESKTNLYTIKKEIILHNGKKVPLQLKDYQKDALRFILSRDTSLVSMDVGTGKSLTIFCTAFMKIKSNVIDYCLIVGTPKSVLSMKKDMEKLTNCPPIVIDSLESFIDFYKQKINKIAFISYQMKTKLTYQKNQRAFLVSEVDQILHSNRVMFLFDEVHKIKNPNSYTTKSFSQLTKYSQYMAGFSGTVYSSNIMDIFYLVDFFDNLVFESYLSFVRSFIVYRQMQIGMKTINIIAYLKNYELLKNKLSTIMYSYYPVLNVVYHENYYEMTEYTKNEYISASLGLLSGEDSIGDNIDEYSDDEGGLFTHSARMIKMQYVLDQDENKQKLLLSLVRDSLDKGCIVYAQYHKTLQLLSDLFTKEGINFRQIHGKMSIKKTEENMEWFTSDSKNKVLFLSDAGGESLNLQTVNDIIFYDVACPIGKLRQVAGRICRLGSSYSQFNIKLILSRDTLDYYKYMYNTSLSDIYMNLFGTHISLPSAEGISSFNSYLLQELRNKFMWQAEKTFQKKEKDKKKEVSNKDTVFKVQKKQTEIVDKKPFWTPNKNRFN